MSNVRYAHVFNVTVYYKFPSVYVSLNESRTRPTNTRRYVHRESVYTLAVHVNAITF